MVNWKFLGTLRPHLLLFTHPAQIISYCSTGPAAICQLLHYVGMWSRQNLLLNTKQQSLCQTSKVWCTTLWTARTWLLLLIYRSIRKGFKRKGQSPKIRGGYFPQKNFNWRSDDVPSVMGGKTWQIQQQVGWNHYDKKKKKHENKGDEGMVNYLNR